MKIAIDIHTLEIKDWAGKEQYLSGLLKTITQQKNFTQQPKLEILVYGRKDLLFLRSKLNDHPDYPYNNIHFVSHNIRTPFWQIWLLFNMKKNRVDHFLSPCGYLAAALNIFIPQTIIVYDLTAFLPGIRKTHTWLLRLKEMLTLFLATRNSRNIISISENTKKDLIKRFPSQQKKISVVYPGSSFQVLDKKDVQWEKKLIILSVGTIEPRKNTSLIISAFEKLKKMKPSIPWELVLVGKIGWKARPILEIIKNSPFTKNIKVTEYISDGALKKYYQEALCLVYPSLYEGFGLPPLEAMSNGCPVIVSQNSSLPEVVGSSGIFFNQGYPIEKAILKLTENKNLREECINKGLVQAKRFNWNSAGQTILKLIKETKK